MTDSVTKFLTSENHGGMLPKRRTGSRRSPFFGLNPHLNIAEWSLKVPFVFWADVWSMDATQKRRLKNIDRGT